MDVELPDGTVIEGVPEGTTKSQLMAKLRASGYDVSKFAPTPDTEKFRFASPETEQAGIGAIGKLARAAEEYFTKPVAPAPANLQAQGYDPLATYGERVVENVPRDVTQIAQGFTAPSLAAAGSALYNQPINTLAGMGSAALQGAGQFVTDPFGTFAEAPVSTIMGLQAAQLARAPGRAAANVLAEVAYPKIRRAFNPENRLLANVFSAPELQAALQEGTPGLTTQQMLADVNAPKAQAVLRQAGAVVPEESRAIRMAQEQERLAQLESIAGAPGELKAAEEARSAAATANYKEAFKQVAPEIPEEFFERPSVKAAAKVADITEAESGRSATPMERLHNIKVGLDDVILNPQKYELAGLEKAAKDTRREFIDYLNTVPEYAKARAEFAAQSIPINRMKVGQEILKAAIEPLTEETTRGGVFARAVEEAPKTIRKATGQQIYSELEQILTPEQMEVVNQIKDQYRRTKLADEQAKLGAKAAPEVDELASAHIASAMNIPFLNRVWTIANTATKRLLGQIDEKTAVKIGLMVQDPAELNRAIAKARRWEKETAQNIEKLRERRRQITKMTPSRAISGAVTFQNVMAPKNRNAMAGR